MAASALSATETALENQRVGGLQLRVAALCTLVQICDGYDLNSVAWAVPSLIRAWHLPPSAFTMAFLWSSIGIMVGALSAGPIGDRFGRRPLLLASLTIFGIASLLSAAADSLGAAERLALLHRARHRRRLFRRGRVDRRLRAAPAARDDDHGDVHRCARWAASSADRSSALLLAHYDWPVIFILGGVFPLVLVLALALWLPESPRFLARQQTLSPRHAALLRRLDIAPTHGHAVDVAQRQPGRMLFSDGYALQTMLLWIIFFCSLMNLFLFAYWMPTVLTLIGMRPPQAVFASSLRDFGAIFAVAVSRPRDRPDRAGTLTGVALRGRRGVHRGDRAGRPALCVAPCDELPGRHDDHRQSDRRQRRPAASSIRRACAPAASDGHSASDGLAASPRRYWAATCWRSVCRRRRSS